MVTVPIYKSYPNDSVSGWRMTVEASGGGRLMRLLYNGLREICNRYDVRFSVMTKFSFFFYQRVVLIFDGRSTQKRMYKFKEEALQFCNQFSY